MLFKNNIYFVLINTELNHSILRECSRVNYNKTHFYGYIFLFAYT